jgi:hypothetical protein
MKNLKLITFKDGSLTKQSSKTPDVCFFRVETSQMVMSNNALLENKVSATVRMKKDLFAALALTAGANLNEAFAKVGVGAHKIIVAESVTPAYEGQSAKINPTTKATILSATGQPIYYNTSVVADVDSNVSVIIPTGAGIAVSASAEALAQ